MYLETETTGVRAHAAGSASESSRSRSRALSMRLPSAILPWLRAGQCQLVRHYVASVAPIRQNTVYYAYCHICELVFEQHPDTPLPRAVPGSSRQTRQCVGVFVTTTILALTLRRCVAKVPHLTVGCIGQVCFVLPLYIRAPCVCLSVPSVCYRCTGTVLCDVLLFHCVCHTLFSCFSFYLCLYLLRRFLSHSPERLLLHAFLFYRNYSGGPRRVIVSCVRCVFSPRCEHV